MNEPLSGDLNLRVTIERLSHVPDEKLGFTAKSDFSTTVWGRVEPVGGMTYWGAQQVNQSVTHRIWVRYSKISKTRPQDLPKVVELVCEGVRYLSKRITDVNGTHRFTLFECECKGVDNALQR